jgi:hypothetical protein
MMDAFEAPKYLSSLIAAANDGAKSAQTAALAFTLVGLYLLATAFSTTDEDLLLKRTITVSQIGVQVPVIFSYAIAPAVFLFLHVYTLIRYDVLAANLSQFNMDVLAVPSEADRERCRHLLANVEFVQARTASPKSALHSWVYRVMSWLLLAGFPVATFVAVQISSLRYQSDAVNHTQFGFLALDLLLLAWFFFRQRRRGGPSGKTSRIGWMLFLMFCLSVPAIVTADWFYLRVARADDETVRAADAGPKWSEAYKQLLDLGLCPQLHWGCRYLRIDHRTLVGRLWNPQAIADSQPKPQDTGKWTAAIDGASLVSRVLRFAKFDDSRLYAADLSSADLRHATFLRADLAGANLTQANLTGAALFRANLSGANLTSTNFSGADLNLANLTNAGTIMTNFSGADMSMGVIDMITRQGTVPKTITQQQLFWSCGDANTKLPEGLTIRPCDREEFPRQ